MLAGMPDLGAQTHHAPLTAMVTVSNAVVLAFVVGLLACSVVFLRSRTPHPWAAILVSGIAAAACFTVGGESATDSAGPSVATIFAGIVGVLCVAAGVVALVPRFPEGPPPHSPAILASSAIALGAVGLLLNVWFG